MEQSKHNLRTYAVDSITRMIKEHPEGPLMRREEIEPVVADLLEALQAMLDHAGEEEEIGGGLVGYTQPTEASKEACRKARAAIERATK